MFQLLSTAGGLRSSHSSAAFLGFIQSTTRMDTVSILLDFTHFVMKFNFVLAAGFPHLSILGRIGAGDDIIKKLVLLLMKKSIKNVLMSGRNMQALTIFSETST